MRFAIRSVRKNLIIDSAQLRDRLFSELFLYRASTCNSRHLRTRLPYDIRNVTSENTMARTKEASSPPIALSLAVLAAAIATSPPARASTPITWLSNSNGSWDTAANWNLNATPASTNDVIINALSNLTITGPANATTINSLTLGNGTASTLLQLQSTGNLTVNHDFTISGGQLIANSSISFGSGNFTQSGGSVSLPSLNLFFPPNYVVNISGGNLSVQGNETLGSTSTGNVYSQSGGNHTVGAFVLADGNYTLSGNATLSAQSESLGMNGALSGNANMIQTGGVNTVGSLRVAQTSGANSFHSLYALSGNSTLSAGDEVIGSGGTGTFQQSGGNNTISNSLTIGHHSATAGGTNSGTYSLSNGTLTTPTETIGDGIGCTGAFIQSGGTHLISDALVIASSAPGNYTLSGDATLSAYSETIGMLGSQGYFQQSGGTHTVSHDFTLGYGGDSIGTYLLSNGTLSVPSENLGFGGSGIFNQSGGTHLISGNLAIGTGGVSQNFGGTGNYSLSGNSTLSVSSNEYVGTAAGNGTFTQSGGIHSIAGTLTLSDTNTKFVGRFQLQNGSLSANATAINANGTFNQSGGNASLGPISGAGSLTISGGTATAQAITLAALSLSNTASLQILPNSQTSNITSLSFAGSLGNWTGSLNISNNKLIIEPAANKSIAFANLQNQVASGAISSSTLPANSGLAVLDNAVTQFTTFGGQPVDTNSLLIAPELLGDTNADGHVDLTDLSTVLNNFGLATPNWTDGSFDHQPTIDLSDLSDVLNNFGALNVDPNASSQSPAPTPEPTTLALLLPAALLLHNRQKRKA